jgi:hypothetical protein
MAMVNRSSSQVIGDESNASLPPQALELIRKELYSIYSAVRVEQKHVHVLGDIVKQQKLSFRDILDSTVSMHLLNPHPILLFDVVFTPSHLFPQ